jgi:hypothetical protein
MTISRYVQSVKRGELDENVNRVNVF